MAGVARRLCLPVAGPVVVAARRGSLARCEEAVHSLVEGDACGHRSELIACGARSYKLRAVKVEGSAALVVGGASGLGEATARALHAKGADVTIADVNADKGNGAGG